MRSQLEQNYTARGMLSGAALGAALAILLFVMTGEALSFIILGLLTGLGISAGAGMEQALDRQSSR